MAEGEGPGGALAPEKDEQVGDSVYKFIEIVGTSRDSWEDAAASAVETAAKSLSDLRIAEVMDLDMQIESGKVRMYRAKVKVSFKYREGSGDMPQ